MNPDEGIGSTAASPIQQNWIVYHNFRQIASIELAFFGDSFISVIGGFENWAQRKHPGGDKTAGMLFF